MPATYSNADRGAVRIPVGTGRRLDDLTGSLNFRRETAGESGRTDNANGLLDRGRALCAGSSGPARLGLAIPYMHATDSVDYAIRCSRARIDTTVLDDSEVHLNQGDIMVQQGNEPCLGEPASNKPCARSRSYLIDAAGAPLVPGELICAAHRI